MESEKQEQINLDEERLPNKRGFNIFAIVINGLITTFCVALIPILYFFSEITVSMEIVTTIYSIDWTIFGIFIAVAGIFVATKHNKKFTTLVRFLDIELKIILANSLVSCLMLFVTTFFIFTNDYKLFMSATFSTLFLLSTVFVNYIFLLFAFVLDRWPSKE